MDKKPFHQSLPVQNTQESSTLTPAQGYRRQTFNVLDNPLYRIEGGSMSIAEIVEEIKDLTEIPPQQIEAMLNSFETREGILLPSWWKTDPQEFLTVMKDSLIAMGFKPGLPLAEQQLKIAEALLNMWDEHR